MAFKVLQHWDACDCAMALLWILLGLLVARKCPNGRVLRRGLTTLA